MFENVSRELRLEKSTATLMVALALTCMAAACASSGVTRKQSFVGEAQIRPPSVVLVYDFAVTADEVVVDTFGPAFLSGEASESERYARGREIARMLGADMVNELVKHGIRAERATQYTQPPLDAILVKGQFITVNEGDQAGRVAIGFGRGTSGLRAQIQTYQATPQGLLRLHEGELEAEGTKKPGMAVPIAGGAAMGSAAASAVISGGMTVATERRGGLEGDVDRMAEEFAKRAEALYKRRGWLQ